MKTDIVVPIAFFVCVAIVAGLVLVGYIRHNLERHQTLRAMVEKGMEIPPQLLGEGKRPPSPRRDLRRGILLMCTGVGIGLFLLFEDGPEEAALGLIPLLIGIGYLIVARLDSKADRQPGSPPAVDELLAR